MNPEAAADTAVLVSALLTLLAIISKLVTANLVTRSKRVFAKLDVRRREIVSRLKEVQLKTTSAKGTLEFWERRRTEISQRVQDASRDLENYVDQFGADDDGWETEGEEAAEAESDMESEPAPEAIGEERGDSSVGETDAEDGPPVIRRCSRKNQWRPPETQWLRPKARSRAALASRKHRILRHPETNRPVMDRGGSVLDGYRGAVFLF